MKLSSRCLRASEPPCASLNHPRPLFFLRTDSPSLAGPSTFSCCRIILLLLFFFSPSSKRSVGDGNCSARSICSQKCSVLKIRGWRLIPELLLVTRDVWFPLPLLSPSRRKFRLSSLIRLLFRHRSVVGFCFVFVNIALTPIKFFDQISTRNPNSVTIGHPVSILITF